eukprot:Em0007g1459a
MQLGLCIFTEITSEDKGTSYTISPYNFYMFPASTNYKLDQRFMCQSSSLAFLATHNMDFNKWIKGGIPYLNEKDEAYLSKTTSADEMEAMLGLSKVIKAITAARAPLVGHNCLLDLLHLFKHFVGPLPDTLAVFKAELLKRFPCVYDTKTVAKHSAFEDCILSDALGDLFDAVHGEVFQEVGVALPPSCPHYSTSQAHEAAYDAYMTGVSLLRMAKRIVAANGRVPAVTSVLEQLAEHKNRVFLHKSVDVPWLHLDREEPARTVEHVLHMTFDERMTLPDIKGLFSPYGSAHVTWINSTSAFVTLPNKEKASEALRCLSGRGEGHNIPYTVGPASARKRPLDDKQTSNCDGQPPPSKKPKQLFTVNEDW